MNRWTALCFGSACSLASACRTPAQLDESVRFVGLELAARDVAASLRFYVDGLGFSVVREADSSGAVVRHGDLQVVLLPTGSGQARVASESTDHRVWRGPYLNMRVADLALGLERAIAAGGRLLDPDPSRNAIGWTHRLLDPGGNPVNLMELDAVHGPHHGEPDVFNVGLRSVDLTRAEAFYARLGFRVPTRNYLPATLPLAREGCESLVVHHDAAAAALPSAGRLVFEVADLGADGWRNVGPLRTVSDGRRRTVALPDGVDGVIVDRLLQTETVVRGHPRAFVSTNRLRFGSIDAYAAAVALADFDRDGDLDILSANGRHWARRDFIYWNAGFGDVPTATALGSQLATSYSPAVADLNGDGFLDIVVARDRAPCQVFEGAAGGSFVPGQRIGSGGPTRAVAAADVSGDGVMDLVFSRRGGRNCVAYGPAFEVLAFFGEAEDTVRVALGDLDGDGDIDAVFANLGPEGCPVFLNDGHGRFERSIRLAPEHGEAVDVAIGDMNRDGLPDLAFASLRANTILLNHPERPFEDAIVFGLADERSHAIELADLDRDGALDVVVGNDGAANAVYYNADSGLERHELSEDPAARSYDVAVGDLDGDGFPDLVFANSGCMSRIHLSAQRRDATPRSSR